MHFHWIGQLGRYWEGLIFLPKDLIHYWHQGGGVGLMNYDNDDDELDDLEDDYDVLNLIRSLAHISLAVWLADSTSVWQSGWLIVRLACWLSGYWLVTTYLIYYVAYSDYKIQYYTLVFLSFVLLPDAKATPAGFWNRVDWRALVNDLSLLIAKLRVYFLLLTFWDFCEIFVWVCVCFIFIFGQCKFLLLFL